jgi:hypothetical protein
LASSDAGARIASLADSGVPLQLSVGLYNIEVEEFSKPKQVELNGRVLELSSVIRNGVLREVSFTPLGADPETRVEVFHFSQGDTRMLDDTHPRIAELEAELAAKKAENAVLQAEILALRADAREGEIKRLFFDLGREYTAESAAPYAALDAQSFAAIANDMRKFRPARDESLLRDLAIAPDGGKAKFFAPAGYTVDAERLDLHQRAMEYAAAHQTDYQTALTAVSQ